MAQPKVTESPPSRRSSRAERRLAARAAAKHPSVRDGQAGSSVPLAPLKLPLAAILIFASFCLLPRVYSQPGLLASFGAATGVLLVLYLFLRVSVHRAGRVLSCRFVPNRVHYVQLVMQCCIFAYWGLYWDEVYPHIPLILSQIAFMYALDMMVCWSRRDTWILGFSPFPIVFSTNLFLWFRDDWFWMQFLLIATIVLCKEFIRWDRDGRRIHIFNPSAIALFLFSAGLLAAHATDITWGERIAGTEARPPLIYVELFVLGLIVQGLFSVTLVTLSSGVVLYVCGLAFTHATGEYYFIDSNIDAAVFLGFLLLVTDPVTSPRRLTGKAIFGGLYGAGVFALYSILGHYHAPQFYDKLLWVPILNLMVRGLDRFSEALAARFHPLNLLERWGLRNLNYAHMAVWTVLFAVMLSTGFLGRGRAAKVECEDGNAAACLEYGKLMTEGGGFPVSKVKGGESLARACSLDVPDACQTLTAFIRSGGLKVFKDACDDDDSVACFLSGWVQVRGLGVTRNDSLALPFFEKACHSGFAPACASLGR